MNADDTRPADERQQPTVPRDLANELRHVTAPPGPTPHWGSDESARLRETWLAFGEMLEAAGPGEVDEAALVEAARSRAGRQRRAWPSWPGVAAAAAGIAAAVLVAAMLTRAIRPGPPAAPAEVATGPLTPSTGQTSRPTRVASATPPPHSGATTRAGVMEIAWDDSIGGRLEPVRRSVRRLQAGPNRHAERVDGLRARMTALQSDWSRDRL